MSRPGFKSLAPFNPTQLSGCQMWLDGSDPNGTGILPSNGATVSTWRDKSTANNSVTLTSSTYSLNSTTGRYGIYFNLNPSSAVTLTPYMSFFVSSYANINFTSSFPGVFGTGVTSGYVFMFGYNGGGGNFMGAGGGIGGYATNTFGNFSSDARNMVVSESFCIPPNSFNMKIGAGDYNGNFWVGHIYEVIVYNATLTQLQYQNVEAYLAQKWGMKSFFPQSHVANTAVIYPNPRRTAPAALQLPYYNSFSLSSITSASLALWLDAADASTVTGTSPITAWTDKSGLGRSVTIVSGPTYGSTTRNGLNTLSFNNNTITSSIASAVGTGDFVLVAVWYQSSAGTNTVLSLGTSASSSQSLGFSGNKYNFYQYGSAAESAYSQTTPSFVIQIGTRQSSVKAVYVNGTVGTTPSSDSYNQTVTTVTIGKGDAFAITGEVAEIMVWTGTMNSTDRQLLESYLAQKWGLQSSLPVTHSNRTTPAGLPPIVQQVYGQVQRNIFPYIIFVTSGLLFHLDAGNPLSYPGSGSTWTDLAGSGLTTTLYNSPTYSSANGGYLSFTSSSFQYGKTSASLSLLTIWSVEVWHYYTNTNQAGSPCIVSEIWNNSPINFTIGSATGANTALQAAYFNSAWYTTTGSYSLPSTGWYHIVGTYDGTTINLYINNVVTQTQASATTPSRSGLGIHFMRRWDLDNYWGGYLSIVRIYNRALQASEIAQNYAASKGRFGLS